MSLLQIDKVTQQNTASAEETASAAQELSSQAQDLQGLLGSFQLSSDIPADTRVLEGVNTLQLSAATINHSDVPVDSEEQ